MVYSVLDQNGIQTLVRLGLNPREAKIYLALVISGISTTKKISQFSKVARPDIYRVMRKLEELGLAEEMITIPAKFKAIPIQEGISILLDRKIRETRELRQESKGLLKKFKGIEAKTTIQEEDKQFVLIPGIETLTRRLKKAAENAQSSIDVLCSKEAFPKGLLHMDEAYEKALRKGVKIRWILEKPKDANSWQEIVQDFMKNPSFKLRVILKPPEARFGMFDKKEAFIATHPTMCALESAALWTNNSSILKIAHDYFEMLWITALENLHEEQPIADALI